MCDFHLRARADGLFKQSQVQAHNHYLFFTCLNVKLIRGNTRFDVFGT